ncbi:MAG: LytTR family transcriptional regulator [Bacteroidales bacterium]|nr:LytTR family transcriptional regulator [Bacteroidales bacterium]
MANSEHFIPANIQKPGPTILHILGIPAFCVFFVLIFLPFHLEERLNFPVAHFQFNVLIIASIMLVVYIASRVPMCAIRRNLRLSWGWYLFWSILEVAVISFFTALYVWLVSEQAVPYMGTVFTCFSVLAAIISIPFSIIALALTLKYTENKQFIDDDIENARVRFYDEKRNLKLVVRNNSIYFIEADENYVNIHYTEGEKMRSFSLRSSMKAIDDLCSEHKIVRCHRSYYINPKHIKVLRKEKEGVTYAEMDSADGQRIPVSKRYYDQIIELL